MPRVAKPATVTIGVSRLIDSVEMVIWDEISEGANGLVCDVSSIRDYHNR